uniref:SUN domain-containing protein n=1 Tax=Rhabditophanes sp. KR3021 TaxID=114890 RepID=A0AC35TK22_9BILA
MMFKNIKYERLDNGNEENTSKTIGLTFYKAIVFWVLLFVVIITHLNTFYNVDDGISNFLSISLDNRDFLENEYAQLKMNNSNPKGCSIPKHDPWSKSALKYMQKKDNYELKKCNVTYVNDFVSFEEGILNIHPEKSNEDECLYQCIFPLNDWRFTEGNWTIIEKDTVPDCDVFHVECKSENGTATFNDLYLQINKIDFKPADNVDFLREGYDLPKNIHNYSVYIILLDSLSVGHATVS